MTNDEKEKQIQEAAEQWRRLLAPDAKPVDHKLSFAFKAGVTRNANVATADFHGEFDRAAVERLLATQPHGVVASSYLGNGRVYFSGPPSAAFRALRARIRALVKQLP